MKNAVLITGATSGIGFELSRLFAKDKNDMVIVGRYEDTLSETRDILLSDGAASVKTIRKDLSVFGTAAEIYEQTESEGINIHTLVNDAGMGEHGFFSETDLDKELDIIQLNITSLVHLTKLYLGDMLRRNEGRILQVASISSYQPTPLLAVYAATKSFVLSFTDALIDELKDTKVTMTALIPGPTDTDFFRKANMEHTVAAKKDPEDPAVVARIGYEALLKGEHHALAPGMTMQVLMSSLMPSQHVAKKAHSQMEPAKE